MKIGIIGAGEIGNALALNLTKLGHSVKIANSRGPETLTDLGKRTGATPVTVADAVKDVDLIVITVAFGKIAELPKTLFADVPVETVIVETGNYSPVVRDAQIDAIEGGMTETRWVSEQIGRPVTKAFNNLFAKELVVNGLPAGDPERIAIPVAGDDPRAKAIVMDLVDSMGFDAVDSGSVDEAWRHQLGTPVSSAVRLNKAGLIEGLAQADKDTLTERRNNLLNLVLEGVVKKPDQD